MMLFLYLRFGELLLHSATKDFVYLKAQRHFLPPFRSEKCEQTGLSATRLLIHAPLELQHVILAADIIQIVVLFLSQKL